jgi:hypothetical protein
MIGRHNEWQKGSDARHNQLMYIERHIEYLDEHLFESRYRYAIRLQAEVVLVGIEIFEQTLKLGARSKRQLECHLSADIGQQFGFWHARLDRLQHTATRVKVNEPPQSAKYD